VNTLKTNRIPHALYLLSAFFLMAFSSAFGQNPLRLVEGADDILVDGKTGNYIVRGDVRLVKDDVRMFCDSASYNAKKRYVKAFGNVHINKQDTLNLYCDSLFYDIEPDFAKLWGNVRVRDNEYLLVTDSLDFYGKENKAVYRNNGVITNIMSPERLESKVGHIYTESKNFFFRGDVVYTNEQYKITTDTLQFNGSSKKAFFYGPTNIYSDDGHMYCEEGWYHTESEEGVLQTNAFIDREREYIAGDSLYYNRPEGLSIGVGNVLIRDTTNKIEFTGDFARSEELNHFAFITGHALARRFEDDEDTLYIHADTLFNYLDTLNEPKLIVGYYGVKLFKSDMQGVCDSISYDREKGEMNMYHEPVLWAKNAQLTGDTISVYEKDGDIRRAFLRLQAIVVTEVDTGKYYNQVAGKTMNAYFDSSEIRRIDFEGNAQTVAYLEDEDENDSTIIVTRSGMNRIYASNFTLRFKGGNISSATYRDAPDGAMYPMDQIKESEKEVAGFKWDNTRRPISWQTMIMTPEEFKIWEIHQAERKELLRLTSLAKMDSISMDRAARSRRLMEKYIQENRDTLFLPRFSDSIDTLANEQLDSIELLLNDFNRQLNLIVSEINNAQFCIAEGMGIPTVFDSLGRFDIKEYKPIDNLNPIDLGLKRSVDSTFLSKNPLQLDSVFRRIPIFKDSILAVFPDFSSTAKEIRKYEQKVDSIEAEMKILNLAKKIETSYLTLRDSLEIGDSLLLDSLTQDALLAEDSTFLKYWMDLELQYDSLSIDERTNRFDTLQKQQKLLIRPKLRPNQKVASQIDDLLNLEKFVCPTKEPTKENRISWYDCFIREQSAEEALIRLEALKIDLLNAYREVLFYFL
jgi:lipopolysaccharide export system protein LptA